MPPMADKIETISVSRKTISGRTREMNGFFMYGNIWGNPSVEQESPLEDLVADTVVLNGQTFTSNKGLGYETTEILTAVFVSKEKDPIAAEALIENRRERNQLIIKTSDSHSISLGNPFAFKVEYGAVLVGRTVNLDGTGSHESSVPFFGEDLSTKTRSLVVFALVRQLNESSSLKILKVTAQDHCFSSLAEKFENNI